MAEAIYPLLRSSLSLINAASWPCGSALANTAVLSRSPPGLSLPWKDEGEFLKPEGLRAHNHAENVYCLRSSWFCDILTILGDTTRLAGRGVFATFGVRR